MAGRKPSPDLTVVSNHSGPTSPFKSVPGTYEFGRNGASPTGSGSNAAQRLFRRTTHAPHVDTRIRRPCTPPNLPSSPGIRGSAGFTVQLDFPGSPQVGDARSVRVSESAERPMTAPSSLSQHGSFHGTTSPWAATRQRQEADFLSNSPPPLKESPRRGEEFPRPESPYRKTFKLRPNTHNNEALQEEMSYREEVADAIATVLRELERRGGASSNYGAVISMLQRMAAAPHHPSRTPPDTFVPTLSCILPPEGQSSTLRGKDGMNDRTISRRDISYLSDSNSRTFVPRVSSEVSTSLWDARNSHDLLCRDAGGVYAQVLACQHITSPKTEIPEKYHVTMAESSVELMLTTAEAAARTAKGKKDPTDAKFPSRQPSSRWEVLQLAKTVDDMMMELDLDVGGELGRGLHTILLESQHGAFGRVVDVVHIALRELTRQVFVHCAERGALMAVLVQNLETMLAEATGALADARADNRQLREQLSSSDARHREEMEASQQAYALQEELYKDAEEAQKGAYSKLEKKFRQALEQLELKSRERDSLEMQVDVLQKGLTDKDKEIKSMLMEYAEKQEWHVQRRKKEIEVCFKREKDLLTLIKELRDNRVPVPRDPLGEIAAVEQRAAAWEAWAGYLLRKELEMAIAPPSLPVAVPPAWEAPGDGDEEGDEEDRGEGEEGGRALVDVVVVDFRSEGGRAGCKLVLEDIGEWIARRPEQFHLLVLDRASLEEVYDKHVDLDELLASVKTLNNTHLVAIHSTAAAASLLKPHMANPSGALFRLGARASATADLSHSGSASGSGAFTARGSPISAAGASGGAAPAGGFCLLGVPDEKLDAAQAFSPELRAYLVRDESTQMFTVTCVRNYYPLDIADLRFEGPGMGSGGATSARQLASEGSPTHQQQQLVLWERASSGVQMVLVSFNARLRRIFQHYALFAGAVGMDNPYFMSLNAFNIFVKDCKIKLTEAQLHSIFASANTHIDAPTKERKEGDDANDMTLHEFYAAIVRVAALKRRRGTLSLDAPLFELITQKILPHAKSLKVDAVFQAQFASKEVADVLTRTRPQLQRVFATFAAMGSDAGGAVARTRDGPGTSEMDYQEWVLFARRAGLIGAGVSVSKAIACYVLANESFVTTKGEVSLDDKDQAMSFPEFEYAVAMLAYNLPSGRKKVSMAARLLAMLTEKVFTNLKAAGVQ